MITGTYGQVEILNSDQRRIARLKKRLAHLERACTGVSFVGDLDGAVKALVTELQNMIAIVGGLAEDDCYFAEQRGAFAGMKAARAALARVRVDGADEAEKGA